MALTITHPKVVTIADWTQADVDAQIALGNMEAGTLLADIQLASDWNDDHAVTGTLAASSVDVTPATFITELTAQTALEGLSNNARGFGIIDMSNADRTLTDAEAKLGAILVFNSGDGTKTLTWPTTSDGTVASTILVVTAFAGNVFYVTSESWGAPILISAPNGDIFTYGYGSGIQSFYNNTISDTAFSSGWNGDFKAPTKNAVYDVVGPIKTKSDFITVTQAVNLDTMESDIANGLTLGKSIGISSQYLALN